MHHTTDACSLELGIGDQLAEDVRATEPANTDSGLDGDNQWQDGGILLN